MKLINFLTTDTSFVVFTIIHPTQASDSLLHGSLGSMEPDDLFTRAKSTRKC
jgi:hypothetical protein